MSCISVAFILQGKTGVIVNSKRHWLVEQKLLHFVDAFHQYVMDRVRDFSMLKLAFTPLVWPSPTAKHLHVIFSTSSLG